MNIVLMDSVQNVQFTTNYVDKVAGSTTINPNTIKTISASSLTAPSGFTNETSQLGYNLAMVLDGSYITSTVNTNLLSVQHLFSFNLISMVEHRYGPIPAPDTVSKVAWLRLNITNFRLNLYGNGSNQAGNKANLRIWFNGAWVNASVPSNTSSTPALMFDVTSSPTGIGFEIDASGFYHTLTYSEASDGVVSSIINTDYVELVINLNIRQ